MKEKDLQKEEAAEKKQVLQEPKQEEEKDNQINKKPKEDAAFEKRLVNIQSMLENQMKRQEPIKEEKEKAVEQIFTKHSKNSFLFCRTDIHNNGVTSHLFFGR